MVQNGPCTSYLIILENIILENIVTVRIREHSYLIREHNKVSVQIL